MFNFGFDLFMVRSYLELVYRFLIWFGYFYRFWGNWDCYIFMLGFLISLNIDVKGVFVFFVLVFLRLGYEVLG